MPHLQPGHPGLQCPRATGYHQLPDSLGNPLASDQYGYDANIRPASAAPPGKVAVAPGRRLSQTLSYDPASNVTSLATTQAAVPGKSGSGGLRARTSATTNRTVWCGQAIPAPSRSRQRHLWHRHALQQLEWCQLQQRLCLHASRAALARTAQRRQHPGTVPLLWQQHQHAAWTDRHVCHRLDLFEQIRPGVRQQLRQLGQRYQPHLQQHHRDPDLRPPRPFRQLECRLS